MKGTVMGFCEVGDATDVGLGSALGWEHKIKTALRGRVREKLLTKKSHRLRARLKDGWGGSEEK